MSMYKCIIYLLVVMVIVQAWVLEFCASTNNVPGVLAMSSCVR